MSTYTDIKMRVEGQKLKFVSPTRHFPKGSNDFVRFLFDISDDWDGLMNFVQFRQGAMSSNEYLDFVTVTEDGVPKDYAFVCLPQWLRPGPATMVLFGTGNETMVGTTNYAILHIDDNGFIPDAETSDMSETLYQQLINRMIVYESTHASKQDIQYNNVFASVSEMMNSTELLAGMVVRTLSYYDVDSEQGGNLLVKPFGGAEYDIITGEQAGENPPNWLIRIGSADLYARIRGDKVYPEQFGAYRNGQQNDAAAIQKAINTGKVVGLSEGTYKIIPDTTYTHTWHRRGYSYTVNIKYAFSLKDGQIMEGDSPGKSVLQMGGPGYAVWMEGTHFQYSQMRNFRIFGDKSAYNSAQDYDYHGIFIAQELADEDSSYESPSSLKYGPGGWGACCIVENFYMRHLNHPFYGIGTFGCNFRNGTLRWCGSSVFTYGRSVEHAVDGAPGEPVYNDFCNCCVFEQVHIFSPIEARTWVPAAAGKEETVYDENGIEQGLDGFDVEKAIYKGGYYQRRGVNDDNYADSRFINDPAMRLECVKTFEFYDCNFENYHLAFSSDLTVNNVSCYNCHFEGLDYVYRTSNNRPIRLYGFTDTWCLGFVDKGDPFFLAAANAVDLPRYIKRLFRRNLRDGTSLDLNKFSALGKERLLIYRSNFLQYMEPNLVQTPRAERHNVHLYDINKDDAAYGISGTTTKNSTIGLLRKDRGGSVVWDVYTDKPTPFFFYRFGTDYGEINVPINNIYVEDYGVSEIKTKISKLVGDELSIGMMLEIYVTVHNHDPFSGDDYTYCAKYEARKWRSWVFLSEPQVLSGALAYPDALKMRFRLRVETRAGNVRYLYLSAGTKTTYDNVVHMQDGEATYPYDDEHPPVVGYDDVIELLEEDVDGTPTKYAVVASPQRAMSMTILYRIDRCPGNIQPIYRVVFDTMEYGAVDIPEQLVAVGNKVRRPPQMTSDDAELYGWTPGFVYDEGQVISPYYITKEGNTTTYHLNRRALWNFETRTLAATDIDKETNTRTLYAVWIPKDTEDEKIIVDEYEQVYG